MLVTKKGEPVELTQREYELMKVFGSFSGQGLYQGRAYVRRMELRFLRQSEGC